MMANDNGAPSGMSTSPFFQANPFLSQWLSAANSAAGMWRGAWAAEIARQQTELARQQVAMVTEFNRQAMSFWMGAMAPRPPATVPSAPTLKLVEKLAPEPALPVPAVLAAAVEAPTEAEAVVTAPLPIPAEPAAPEVKLPKARKPAQQLRASPPARKAAPRRGSKRPTRH
jgi:hypothetical protein